MESLTLHHPSFSTEVSAETPIQILLPQATSNSTDLPQAIKPKISNLPSHLNQRTQGPNEEIKAQNSTEYLNILRNVYREEICTGNINQDYKLLIISVHAVFLESGFVYFDSVAAKKIDGFRLPTGWDSTPIVNFQYTLPCLLVGVGDEVVETVGLNFQMMGKFLYIHGFLSRNVPLGFIRLDASRFVQSINSICTSSFYQRAVANEESCKSSNEREVFEMWMIAKNGLVLPLLTDLCVKTGLEHPPCFTSLLTDLKLNILEFLSGIDLARVGCVSSELRRLSSNNDLWKKKCIEDFALSDSGELSESPWKDKYVTARNRSKRETKVRRVAFCGGSFGRTVYPRHRGEHHYQPHTISGSQVPNVPLSSHSRRASDI